MLDLEAIRVTRDEVYPTRARLAAADVKDISTWQHAAQPRTQNTKCENKDAKGVNDVLDMRMVEMTPGTFKTFVLGIPQDTANAEWYSEGEYLTPPLEEERERQLILWFRNNSYALALLDGTRRPRRRNGRRRTTNPIPTRGKDSRSEVPR